jgi:hypothetical protein
MSGHPPFGAEVILNGHEYVAAQAQKAVVELTKQENCFTSVSNAADLVKVADTLSQKETAGLPLSANIPGEMQGFSEWFNRTTSAGGEPMSAPTGAWYCASLLRPRLSFRGR